MQKQTSIIIGVIVALAVIVGAVFAYQYFENSQTATINVQNSNIETADWKTYKNDEFGFSIQYPGTWTLKDCSANSHPCLDISNFLVEERPGRESYVVGGEVRVMLGDYKKSSSVTLKDFVSSITYMESDIKATSVQSITIGGINGIKSNLFGDGTYYLPESSTNGIYIEVHLDPEIRENYKETIDKLLSTFKFINN